MSINGVTGRGTSVQLGTTTTSTRQTTPTDFGTMLRNGVAAGAGAVAGAASVAAPYVPGGTVVSAAVNGAAQAMGGTAGDYTGGVLNLPGQSPGPGSVGTGAAPQPGSSMQQILEQTKQMQEMQMSFSLQYLQLQEKMQNENRQFTTISNVMKTKHDTAKNSINNMR